MNFLNEFLFGEFIENLDTKGFREERAYHDGKAAEAKLLLKLLKGLTND
jgi:hypothetical protein